MKLHKFIRRICAAAVASALTLSLCTPVLAEAPPIDAVHLPQLTRSSADAQNDEGETELGTITFFVDPDTTLTAYIYAKPNGSGGYTARFSSGTFSSMLEGCTPSFDGSTLTLPVKNPLGDVKIALNNNYSLNIINQSTELGNIEITDANDVTIEGGTAKSAVSGKLTVSCNGALKITGGSEYAVAGDLTVNTPGDVTVNIPGDVGVISNATVIGGDATILQGGNVKITSPTIGEGTYAVKGKLTVKDSSSVYVKNCSDASIGNGAEITSSGSVTIINSPGSCVVGETQITSGGNVVLDSVDFYAVDGDLTITKSKDVFVNANQTNVVNGNANITSSGKVMLSNDSGDKAVTGTLTYTPDLDGTGYNGYKMLDYSECDEYNPDDVTDLTLQQAGTLSPYIYNGNLFWMEFVPVKLHTVTITEEGGIASAKGAKGVKGVSGQSIRLYKGLEVTIKPGLVITNLRNCSWVGWKTEGVDFTYDENFAGTFTMPDNDVKITPDFRYTVRIGSANNPPLTDAAGNIQYFAPGTTVTLPADLDPNTDPAKKLTGWELTRLDNNALLSSGTLHLNGNYTFTMPNTPVIAVPQYADLYTVTVEGGTIKGTQDPFVRVKAGDKVTIKADKPADENMQFCYWKVEEGTSADFVVSAGKLGSETESGTEPGTEEISLTTFKGSVKLTAVLSGTPATPQPDPDQPLDEDFGVDTPADTGSDAGGAIAAVAVGGAAVWGGYELVTRVMLHSLLPEGAAIPASRGQLALLVWNTAGRSKPVNPPAFADVADPDTARAAQWCVEQGLLTLKKDGSFDPDGWTPKFRVIQVWNKAFPKQ